MINKYLECHYKSGGRGEVIDGITYQDCWGLTRTARHELYGKPLLPSLAGARHGRKGSIQEAYLEQRAEMKLCERAPGAVVSVSRRGICVHVALMVNGNNVLEIKREGQRARLTPWREFARQYPAPLWEIEFYD